MAARLKSAERTQFRQAQILRAARACVRTEGFHAATMSRIAAEASMTAGHIYQYFSSKEAVMIALAEKDMDEFMSDLDERYRGAKMDIESIVKAITNEISYIRNHDQSLIAMEIYAEAARNPNFSELVLRTGELFLKAIRRMIKPLLTNCSDEEIERRAEILLILTRSIVVAPQKHSNKIIAQGLEMAIRGVLAR